MTIIFTGVFAAIVLTAMMVVMLVEALDAHRRRR
jgi:hypothetical protein